jgi:hypothetical protein
LIADFTLDPGDVLYVPRGFLHAAETDTELSVHFTISVHPVTRLDLLAKIVSLIEQDAWFREGVDLRDLLADGQAAQRELASIARRLQDAVPHVSATEVAWDAKAASFGERDAWPLDVFAQYRAIREPDNSVRYRKPAALQWIIQRKEDHVLLRTTLGDFRLNPGSQRLAEAVMSSVDVEVAELSRAFPPKSVLGLVEALARNGVLAPADVELHHAFSQLTLDLLRR